MQQFSRTCKIVDHYQKVIEYVCTYPECKLSRFLCSKCALGQNHKHNQQDNSHIVDQIDFCKQLANNLKQWQQDNKYDLEQSISSLNQIIMEMQSVLKNFSNITSQLEQGYMMVKAQLEDIQKQGFSSIDEKSLNDLINIKYQLNDIEIHRQFDNYTKILMYLVLKIKEWRLYKKDEKKNDIISQEQIQNIRYSVHQLSKESQQNIYSGAISNNLKYIVSGRDNLIDIWDYKTNDLIKSIQVEQQIYSLRFTEDSTILYAGSENFIYQYDVNKHFEELRKAEIHADGILNIYCITNTIILTSSYNGTIIKTDLKLKQQIFKIQAHNDCINGLDYDRTLNIIASGSEDNSIKLWNANDGSIILEKLNAHNIRINQVLFIINKNKLISSNSNIMIWNIDYKFKQLEQQQIIQNSAYNISLVSQQQYIIATSQNFISVYTIDGLLIRSFDHNFDIQYYFNTIQPDSMNAVLIVG